MKTKSNNPTTMLVLWDIDGTLMTTSGAGRAAFLEAGRELFGEHFSLEGVDQLGRLDSVIWRDAAKVNRIDDPDESEIKFRPVYLDCYKYRLISEPTACVLFPGVVDLIDRLDKQDQVIQGLLTGNYPEIGRMKLELAGFDLECPGGPVASV
ncbi:MAG: HAD family hydrolase [Deltaproteobacteria bacterium]|nr:HAD family hydrolase [Deltaproteobacteria bacterium]